MGRRSTSLPVLLICVGLTVAAGTGHAGGVGISVPPDIVLPDSLPLGVSECGMIDTLFYQYRPSGVGTVFWGDLEFQWSRRYSLARSDSGMSRAEQLTLDQLGRTFCETISNPLNALYPDIQLAYDYFNLGGPAYAYYQRFDESEAAGYVIGPARDSLGIVPLLDRSHLDAYTYEPGQASTYRGSYPSAFRTAKEDSSTSLCQDLSCIRHKNALQFPGPPRVSYLDLAGDGWTAPDSTANWGVLHEFQHAINDTSSGSGGYLAASGDAIAEIFSTGAEALVGERPEAPAYEVPYTWPLIAYSNQASCTNLLSLGAAYQNFRLFSTYLLFNFQGLDKRPLLPRGQQIGFYDDLLYRWRRQSRTLSGLRSQLSDAACAECAQLPYFNPGGVALDDTSRLALLLHNWRVANYVNNSALAEGQYGYPPQYGFLPSRDVGAWQSFDGCAEDDLVARPPEVVIGHSQATRETTFVGTRGLPGVGMSYPMALQPLGAEYWVVRSDTVSLGSLQRDLVVRVYPESLYLQLYRTFPWVVPTPTDGRLVASVVAYRAEPANLWDHPELATLAVAPTWVDVDSMAGALEFVVPSFGTTYKAAVVVISLADGPGQALGQAKNVTDYVRAAPYRLTLALRRQPVMDVNPAPLVADAGALDEAPAWAPGDTAIVYVHRSGSGLPQVYRRSVVGPGVGVPVVQPPRDNAQHAPDWSPRGDVVAYEEVGSADQSDIWIAPSGAGAPSQLTNLLGWAREPVFSPNGQRIAFVHEYADEMLGEGGSPGLDSEIPNQPNELYISSLDGLDQHALTIPVAAYMRCPRWAPNGQSIYVVMADSLYRLSLTTGVLTYEGARGRDAYAYDLQRATGATAIEDTSSVQYTEYVFWPESYNFPLMPRRRIAVRTPDHTDTQGWFYRTGAEFSSPRWSYDGTRLVYVTNQNLTSDRDIYIGQVSYNHAPQFVDLVDQGFAACVPFTLNVQATDADDEALTYQALSLPPGATFSNHTFRWQYPQVGTYYVVFRALDQSGGLALQVVMMNVYDDGSCGEGLMAQGSGGSGWTEANSVLGGSSTLGAASDLYRLPATSARSDQYRARLVMTGESGTLDRLALTVVDHAPADRAFACGSSVVLGSVEPATAVTSGSGSVQLSPSPGDGGAYLAASGETLMVRLPSSGQEGAPLLLELGGRLGGASTEMAGVAVQVPENGGWRTAASIAPRLKLDVTAIESIPGDVIRLVFNGQHLLRFVGRLVPATRAPLVQTLAPVSALQTGRGDVRQLVAAGEGSAATLGAGDTLTAAYQVPAPADGLAREFFLLVSGSVSSPRGATGAQRVPMTQDLPAKFALHQNRPNPFRGATAIHFDLPAQERVRLDVFDLQGRLVRTLADGFFEAGYHKVSWDQRDRAGALAAPGVYLYRIRAGSHLDQKKMILLSR